jgi:hypothetical protein
LFENIVEDNRSDNDEAEYEEEQRQERLARGEAVDNATVSVAASGVENKRPTRSRKA